MIRWEDLNEDGKEEVRNLCNKSYSIPYGISLEQYLGKWKKK